MIFTGNLTPINKQTKLKYYKMKTYNKTYLPESIVYNGETYKCNHAISGAMSANNTSPNTIVIALRKQGRKAILVKVLSTNLKSKNDLYGHPYLSTKWIFTTD